MWNCIPATRIRETLHLRWWDFRHPVIAYNAV
jgi:hypothetical protein